MQNHRNNYNKNKRNGRSQNFDSNGPTGRIKGSAKQIFEKYQSLARDAYSTGDNILMENYYQHAEHYFRINNYLNDQAEQKKKARAEQMEAKKAKREQVETNSDAAAKKELIKEEASEKDIKTKSEDNNVETKAKDAKKTEKKIKRVKKTITKKTRIGKKKEEAE
ncbi:MAG: DUF4167 domain-containing protein [Alphaproteobacteria bacterium]|jgi:hypothetical protein|nr:DUF4167 domain-containing protein [Alphaproteobacteria bacterium]